MASETNPVITIRELFKIPFQLIYGVYKISKLTKPIVTIFGGARLKQDDPFAVKAHMFTHMLADKDISVITGGGPGIMHAANCAFAEAIKPLKAKTLGIQVKGLQLLDAERSPVPDPCCYDYITTDYFFTRKFLMMRYSSAFVAFPGGFGTLDELSEVATLIQTKKISNLPLILIGTNYWKPLLEWINNAVEKKLISKEELKLIKITDDLKEALCWVQECLQEPITKPKQ